MNNNYVNIYTQVFDYKLVRSSSSLDEYRKITGGNMTIISHDKSNKCVVIRKYDREEKIKESDVIHLILNKFDYHEGENDVK